MAWPQSQEYNEAIQSPDSSFADPELRRGEAVVNALGLPMPYSGNFADVYQVRCPDGSRWAVKCFTREAPGLRERYQEISAHLRQAKLPFTVEFTYLEQGIRIHGIWYPVLKMQWVEGFTLNDFVCQQLDKPAMLGALLQIWGRMATRLREAGIAHADLQHGNVLLVPGANANSLALKLIDYDGMFVPALAGKKSGEVGHPSYQHPQRIREGTYTLEVDRFPLLLIATSLRCLKAGGRALWEKYDNGDNLLFKEADLRNPDPSALFTELQRLGEPAVAAVRKALAGQLESAPLLDEIMPESRSVAIAATVAPPSRPTAAPPLAVITKAPQTVAAAVAPTANVWAFDEARPAGTKAARSQPEPAKRGGLLLAALAGGVAALLVLVGTVTVGAYFVLKGRGADKVATTDSSQAEKPTVPDKRPEKSVGDSGTKQDKGGPVNPVIDPPDKGPASKPLLPIDPNPQGPFGEVRRFEGHTAEIRRLAVSPDGRQLLTASFDKTIRLWDVATGGELLKWEGHGGERVHGVVFLPDGQRALSCGFDKSVRLWDLKDGHEIRSYPGHTQNIWQVVVSGDGRVAASCGSEDTVFLWDVNSGKVLHRLEGNKGGVESVTLSKDGRFALTGGMEGLIRFWDAKQGTELRSFQGHKGFVLGLAFLPDQRFALSAGEDKTVCVWNVEEGREVRRFEGITATPLALALSSDGGRALLGSDDGSVRLWDTGTGKELYRFSAHQGRVWTVAFSPDGRLAYSAGEDKVVRMWRLPPAGWTPPAPKDEIPIVKNPQQPKPPVPEEAAQAAAEKEIKEEHKDDYAKKKPADIQALASLLRRQGHDSQRKPETRFVLLREARDLAARAGDMDLSMKVADEMAACFDADAFEMKAAALQAAVPTAVPAVRLNLAALALSIAEDAAEVDDYPAAEHLVQVALAYTKAFPSSPVNAAVIARQKELANLRQAYEPIQDAVRTLADKPTDPQSNLALGRFYALAKGDWDRGLALLAKGSDAKLKDLAVTDLATPENAEGAADLGDRYQAQANSESGAAKMNLLCRACYWYEQAGSKLKDSGRLKIAQTGFDIEKTLPLRPVVLFARYGANQRWADVTEKVRSLVLQRPAQKLVFKGSPAEFGDPAFGEHKSLVVVYRYRGGVRLSITGDEETAYIPAAPGSKDTEPGRPSSGQELVILDAKYGNDNRYADATAKTQAAVKGATLAVNPDQLGLGDPYPNRPKAFIIVFRDGGRVRLSVTGAGEVARLGAVSVKP